MRSPRPSAGTATVMQCAQHTLVAIQAAPKGKTLGQTGGVAWWSCRAKPGGSPLAGAPGKCEIAPVDAGQIAQNPDNAGDEARHQRPPYEPGAAVIAQQGPGIDAQPAARI